MNETSLEFEKTPWVSKKSKGNSKNQKNKRNKMKTSKIETLKTIVLTALIAGIIAFLAGMHYEAKKADQIKSEASALIQKIQAVKPVEKPEVKQ